MRRLYCYGKADYCDKDTCTGECEFHDNSGCEYRRIETMSDLIRAMNDDELRNFLCGLMNCSGCAFGTSSGCKLKDWLQMPTKKPSVPCGIYDDNQESGLVEDE